MSKSHRANLLRILTVCLLAACNGAPDSSIVFSLSTSGGCSRNNSCISLTVYDDGKYDAMIGGIHERGFVERDGKRQLYYKILHNGEIDAERFQDWRNAYEDQNFESLKDSLSPGVHAGTFDGTDFMMSVEKNGKSYLLSSIEYTLDSRIPFFEKSMALVQGPLSQTLEKGAIVPTNNDAP